MMHHAVTRVGAVTRVPAYFHYVISGYSAGHGVVGSTGVRVIFA